MVFLELQQEALGSSTFLKVTQGTSHVASRKSSLLLSCEMESGIALEFLQGNRASIHIEGGIQCVFRVAMRTSGNLSCCLRKSGLLSSCKGLLGIPLEPLQGNSTSSLIEAGNSGFLSNCDSDLGVPVKFPQGSQA